MQQISLKDMREEIKDMLSVCFEGKVLEDGKQIHMVLPDGQRFSVSVDEEAA